MIFDEKEYKHKVAIQLRFNDIDSMGIVNNSVYQQYFDVARVHYFKDVIDLDIPKSIISIVVAQIQINYIKPVSLFSQIEIYSKVLSLGEKSLVMKQFIVDKEDGEIKTMNETVMVGFHIGELRSHSLPEEWKQLMKKYEGEIEEKKSH